MHSLNTAYTAFYNTRHRRHGHLFQGRYGAKPVEGDAYLLSLSRYIHLNPVHIKKIKELPLDQQRRYLHLYHWSSYRAYIGRSKAPDWLTPGVILAQCGRTRKEQQKRLLERLRDDRGLRRSVNDIESRLTALSLRSENR